MASHSPHYFTCFKLLCIKSKSRCTAFQVQACQQEFIREATCHTQPTHLEWSAKCPGQLSGQEEQPASGSGCLAFPGMRSCLCFLTALPKVSKLKSSLDAYLRLVKSCWELISVWDFCGLEGVVCDYFVLFLPGKTALPLPRKKLGKVPLTHI